jgi:hypothetical protein
MRQKEPDAPWAMIEAYMWEIGRIPAAQTRVSCWFFLKSCDERRIKTITSVSGIINIMTHGLFVIDIQLHFISENHQMENPKRH